MLDEPLLPDDYPIYADYLYIVDGKLYVSDWHDVTVQELKMLLGAKEIRRCDAAGRYREYHNDEQSATSRRSAAGAG
jgi:hypothetical protein